MSGGIVVPPGDKSITHRAFLLGLMAEGTSRIEHINPGLDCAATLACCEALGARVMLEGTSCAIHGGGVRLREPSTVLDCGNSGTTLRLLAGVLASQPFLSVLAGDASLHQRPVARVIHPLALMGAQLSARNDDTLPPLVIHGGPLRAIDYEGAVASAQVASCVLFAGLRAVGTTSIKIPGPARDHTERMLEAAGASIRVEEQPHGGRRVSITGPSTIRPLSLRVPGDFSSAAFFLAAAAATPGVSVTARGVTLNPTRTGLLDVLAAMGARVERSAQKTVGGEEVGDVTVTGPERLQACAIPPEWVPCLIDEVPAWTIAASVARGRSVLTGAAELRKKESDRLAVLARELTRLGVETSETADGIAIVGGKPRGGTVTSAGDHRIGMCFAVLGTLAEGPVVVEDTDPIATSFPDFARTLVGLGGDVHTKGAA